MATGVAGVLLSTSGFAQLPPGIMQQAGQQQQAAIDPLQMQDMTRQLMTIAKQNPDLVKRYTKAMKENRKYTEHTSSCGYRQMVLEVRARGFVDAAVSLPSSITVACG